MGCGPAVEGDAVPDGLYPGDGSPYLQECVRLGPQTQLRSLLYTWLPLQRHPEVTHKAPQAVHASPSMPPDQPN